MPIWMSTGFWRPLSSSITKVRLLILFTVFVGMIRTLSFFCTVIVTRASCPSSAPGPGQFGVIFGDVSTTVPCGAAGWLEESGLSALLLDAVDTVGSWDTLPVTVLPGK